MEATATNPVDLGDADALIYLFSLENRRQSAGRAIGDDSFIVIQHIDSVIAELKRRGVPGSMWREIEARIESAWANAVSARVPLSHLRTTRVTPGFVPVHYSAALLDDFHVWLSATREHFTAHA